MMEPPSDEGPFEFDPTLVDLADELAEAFILEEIDPTLLDSLDQEYLELLAQQSPENLHMDVPEPVLAAAIQVAAMIAGRMEAAETRNTGRPSRIPYSR
jgi:hypothetical protein